MAQPQQGAVLASGCHWIFTQEKCPQSPPAVAAGAFSSLKTFQSCEHNGDWEERGAKQAASHPSSATGHRPRVVPRGAPMAALPSCHIPDWCQREPIQPCPEMGCCHEQDGRLLDSGPSKTVPITIGPPGGLSGTALLELFVRAGFIAAPTNPLTAPHGR